MADDAKGLTNCTFIGFDAGTDMLEGDGIVIIGDGIRSMDTTYCTGVLFLGNKVAIGTHLCGIPINLQSVIKEIYYGNTSKEAGSKEA